MPQTRVTKLDQISTGSIVRMWIKPLIDEEGYPCVTQTTENDVHLRPDAGENDPSQQWIVTVNPSESDRKSFLFKSRKNYKLLGANKNGDLGASLTKHGEREWFSVAIMPDHKIWGLLISHPREGGPLPFYDVYVKDDTQSLLDATGSGAFLRKGADYLAQVQFTLVHD
ncbi:hypothetical protein PENFLA_c098G08821 [Penicillium flavigenum]|uniref:Uncharacterized protein n=1 Tax=Penicillium flavigenum TaxID=254877 RepID=A0A1V6S859_9EURO|nr:hypothetical protein PENFLA_c098G08821 [Penicillium flavigenum]